MVEARLKSLKAALVDAERMNRALKLGRTPATVIAVLRHLRMRDCISIFTVVGTHALDAYEVAAGVRIDLRALATMDVDLLRGVEKSLSPSFRH